MRTAARYVIEHGLARQGERLLGKSGCDKRIAIAVAADPGAESQTDRQA